MKAGFVVDRDGDTLIHKQLVAMVDDDVYYLSNSYNWNDDGTLQHLGDSIICTIKFNNEQ